MAQEDRSPSNKRVLIGRSHGEPSRFSATLCRWNEATGQLRWGSISDTNTQSFKCNCCFNKSQMRAMAESQLYMSSEIE